MKLILSISIHTSYDTSKYRSWTGSGGTALDMKTS
jgi:hypothetical protein